jgi:hypothetical protein
VAIDPRATAALGVQGPPQEQNALFAGGVGGQSLRLEQKRDLRLVAMVEGRRQFGAIGAGFNLAQLESIAEEQGDSIKQNRFAGAGFTRQYRETTVEFQLERIDDDDGQ